MEFRLTYAGPLPAHTKHGVSGIKHKIRRHLHPQLKDLCDHTPALRALVRNIQGDYPGPHVPIGAPNELTRLVEQAVPRYGSVGNKFRFGGFEFVPLIIGEIHAVCYIDILFLRREKPGALISKPKDEYGGDLDNRLKIFFDALRAPHGIGELPEDTHPSETERPFYCLLEDDSLITRFSVESDTLLGPQSSESQSDVSLVAKINMKLTRITMANVDFAN